MKIKATNIMLYFLVLTFISCAVCNRVYVHPFNLYAYGQYNCNISTKGTETSLIKKAFIPLPIEHETSSEKEHHYPEKKNQETKNRLRVLVKLLNFLGLRIYGNWRDRRSSGSENIFFSPVAIFESLVTLFLGANNQTAIDIQELLGLTKGPNCTFISGVISDLQDIRNLVLENGSGFHLSTISWIFSNHGISLSEQFVNDTEELWGTGYVRAVNFTKPEQARDLINAFIDATSAGKVKKILKDVSSSTTLLLANFAQFQGKWGRILQSQKAGHQDFWINPIRKVPVSMLSQSGKFQYKRDEEGKFSLVKLPLGGNIAMLVIKPSGGSDLENIESNFFTEYSVWMQNMTSRHMNIYLPKISIDASYNLKEILINMNLAKILGEHAEFRRISDTKLNIGKVSISKTLELEEKQEETDVENFQQSNSSDILEIKLNKPFLLVAFEETTEAVLFLSRIVNPNN
uniref:Angiotensinogen n=1 Tax=Latimeria chalumnae TaxID=7897 RepID=H2ZVC7_LATCH